MDFPAPTRLREDARKGHGTTISLSESLFGILIRRFYRLYMRTVSKGSIIPDFRWGIFLNNQLTTSLASWGRCCVASCHERRIQWDSEFDPSPPGTFVKHMRLLSYWSIDWRVTSEVLVCSLGPTMHTLSETSFFGPILSHTHSIFRVSIQPWDIETSSTSNLLG